jgi:glutamate 5-kinase
LADQAGCEFARGLANYDARDVREIAGRRSDEIPERLGSLPYAEVVHRDNLVILEGTSGG